MNCLDTSFIVDLLRGNGKAVKKYGEMRGGALSTTAITAFELLQASAGKQSGMINDILSKLDVLEFGLDEALEAAEIEKELKAKGAMINKLDVLIAGIARRRNLTLVTADKDFKKIPELQVSGY